MKSITNSLGDNEYLKIVVRDRSQKIEIIIMDSEPNSYGTSMFLSKQQVLNLIKDLKYIIGE